MTRAATLAVAAWLSAACSDAAAGGDVPDVDDVADASVMVAPRDALPARPAVQSCFPDPDAPAPATLSETGCYTGVERLAPAADLVPYEVNAALWTDGADKHRFIVLPPGATLDATSDPWRFPVGSVLVKTFAFARAGDARADGEQGRARPVETRLMVRTDAGWRFLTYVWRDDGSDAERMVDGDVLALATARGAIAYVVPSEEQCAHCHAVDAEQVLGPRTGQLRREVAYEAGRADQLEVFAALGMFDAERGPRPVSDAPAWPAPFAEGASLGARARAYLAANCAHCHQPGGWQPPPMTMDLRYALSLAETRLCNEPIQYVSPHADGELRVAPGDPAASNLFQRMIHPDFARMPPLAVSQRDEAGIALVEAWIASLDGCP